MWWERKREGVAHWLTGWLAGSLSVLRDSFFSCIYDLVAALSRALHSIFVSVSFYFCYSHFVRSAMSIPWLCYFFFFSRACYRVNENETNRWSKSVFLCMCVCVCYIHACVYVFCSLFCLTVRSFVRSLYITKSSFSLWRQFNG